MSRVRVVTVIDSLSPENLGGGERLAALVAMRLDPARFERALVSTRPSSGFLADEVRAAGVELLALDRRGPLDLREWRRLHRFLRGRFDVLHAHKFGSNVWGTLLGRLAGVPVVIAHEHSWSYEGGRLRRLLDRELVGRGADVFLAVSREDRRRMVEVEGVPAAKARYLAIGIPELPPPAGRDLRAELGIPAGAPVAGTACALRPEKALDVLLRAAVELPELHVVIAGRGEEEPRLRRLAHEPGLAGRVHLLGFVPPAGLADVLAGLDVGVSSSDREGSPLSVMELMAAGRAIVATRVGGTPDLIEDGVHGLLVPPRNPPALAAAIRRLLDDPALRARLGAAARERQRAELDLDVFVRRLEELYAELLSKKA
jgi:glycosyltransferase involved in cell wall biosynthesis